MEPQDELRAPAVGMGVTVHVDGCWYPGTIVLVAADGTALSFRFDAVVQDRPGRRGRFVPESRAKAITARRDPDGIFRIEPRMNEVEPGARRYRSQQKFQPGLGGRRGVTELADAVERLEPRLLRRLAPESAARERPELIASARGLLAELEAMSLAPATDRSRVSSLRARLDRAIQRASALR